MKFPALIIARLSRLISAPLDRRIPVVLNKGGEVSPPPSIFREQRRLAELAHSAGTPPGR